MSELVGQMAHRAKQLVEMTKNELIDVTLGLPDTFGDTESPEQMKKADLIEAILLEEFSD